MLCKTLASCREALPFRPFAPVQGQLHGPLVKNKFPAVENTYYLKDLRKFSSW